MHTTPITIHQQRPEDVTPRPLPTEHPPVEHLYLHVPFCFHKCHYCDFYSFVDSRDRQPAFVDALLLELDTLATHAGPLRTVFVGGGTPSLLRPELWRRLLDRLACRFDLSSLDEFTVECNPETVTAELMRTLVGGGVNRISVGAQTFDERHLKTLERWHDPANVERALALAADSGIGRRSIDLIFAIPGQSLDDWRRDLDVATGFAHDGLIDHASCYALTFEPNTAMTVRMQRGDFTPADDDLEAEMYLATVDTFAAVGLARYEVSNFAKPGGESAHNVAYWRQQQWLAAGPSASAHVAGHRWKNVPRLTDWIASIRRDAGLAAIVDHEPPDARRALAERIMMGLRIADGVDARELCNAADVFGRADALRAAAEAQRAAGLLDTGGGRWRLTDRGMLFCDGVAGELMDAVS
jgi:oxygen-independent coproporphyrinogen-3 oxidase